MRLSNEELKKIYFGAYRFEETGDGFLQAFQYTKAQEDYFKKASDFWFERCTASTAKTLEFTSDATKVSFDYKIIWKGSEDSVELTVDGIVTKIYYVKDLKDSGNLEFELPAGEKKVVIYLPADATMVIKNFEADSAVEPALKGEKVLWLGDSITQGFGPLRSSCIYVSVANRLLNYDIINQGIGGYVYDKNVLMKMEGYKPDKIIVSLGTNQFGTESMQGIEEYYELLMKIYGNDIPVLAITPLWRGDVPDGEPTLIKFCNRLKDICSRYKNIKIVDGFKLVPHLPEYYLDNLHPNVIGAEVYGRNLVEEIRRIGF
ncbi:MAG: SGNH/GDSL hydrolase family protein [Lachnospiraceae bacterium]|nr:SGNH/GDSL hydrolase family protein [Lachnospiraceae bacterium]